mgnify:CR=1 FL=1
MRYEKDVPVLGDFDVVVCGAGVAGFCAAVQAARAGAKTALVERYGMPGGVLTVGGNNEIGLFYRGSRPIIAGIGWGRTVGRPFRRSVKNTITASRTWWSTGRWPPPLWTPCARRRG